MQENHPLGTLAALWRYPVKALAAEPLQTVHVGQSGLDGDRAAALFVETPGHARAGRPYRGKEHPRLHTVANASAAAALAAERGVTLAERSGGPHFDAGVVSIVIDRWLAELEAYAGGERLDPQRFRPNFYLRAHPGFARSEAELVGCEVQAGDAVLRVVDAIRRCVTINYDPQTGDERPEVLQATARRRGNIMGVYCDVLRPARVALGAEFRFA